MLLTCRKRTRVVADVFFFGLMVRVVNVFFVSLEIFFLKLNSLNFWGFGQLEMENMVTVVYKLHQWHCSIPPG